MAATESAEGTEKHLILTTKVTKRHFAGVVNNTRGSGRYRAFRSKLLPAQSHSDPATASLAKRSGKHGVGE